MTQFKVRDYSRPDGIAISWSSHRVLCPRVLRGLILQGEAQGKTLDLATRAKDRRDTFVIRFTDDSVTLVTFAKYGLT